MLKLLRSIFVATVAGVLTVVLTGSVEGGSVVGLALGMGSLGFDA